MSAATTPSSPPPAAPQQVITPPRFRRLRAALREFMRNKLSVAAACVIVVFVTMAAFAPWLAPHDPMATSMQSLSSPQGSHLMGTDQLGRDVLSRVIFGSRISLWVAGLSVGLSLVAGTLMGVVAGYAGGWVDSALSRGTDVMLSLPEVVLALVVLAVLGPGFFNISLAIAVAYTPIFARISRGAIMRLRNEPYVEAARALGLGHVRIMARHLLPNAAGPIIVQTTLSLAFAILAEAALSFLGLSGETDTPSWGLMLRQGKDYMELAWWLAVFPGIAVTLAVFSFNVLGDGLRDMLDPHSSKR